MTLLYPDPSIVESLAPSAILHRGVPLSVAAEYHLARAITATFTRERTALHHARLAHRLAALATSPTPSRRPA